MTVVFADRVKETTATTGTGILSLGGAVTGFQTFYAGVGSGVIVPYCIDDGTNWEVGTGTVTHGTPDTLSRTVLYASSTGSLINWAAGTKNVYLVLSAHDIIRMGNNSPINNQTASYVLVLGDAGYLVRMNSSSATTVTIPPNSSVAFNVGDTVAVEQVGVGSVTLVAGAGVTINSPPSSSLLLAGQNARVVLTKEASTDTWSVSNGLTSTIPAAQAGVINSSTGDLPINYNAGNVVNVTLNHALSTVTFSNWPASGTEGRCRLWFTADGTARATTWLINGVTGKWAAGTPPTMSSTSGYVDGVEIYSSDGLITIRMHLLDQAIH